MHGLSKHSLINKVKQSRYKQSYAKNQSLIIEHAVKDNIYLKKSAEYQNNKHNGGQYDTKNLLADFDFISLKETRKSIHRLVNMSVFTTQKLAFTLYDRNHDGVIDRKDLIPLFNLVDTLPVLSGDISKMVRALTSLHKRRRNRTMAMHASVYEEPSLTNLPTKTQTSSARFDTRRFYSFFRSNE